MISNRLKAIAKYLENKRILADVGCDHGYVIIEGFLNYGLIKAYAIDNKEGPLENAKNNISSYDFLDKVEFLLSDGLEKLDDYVDVIVFAGMGGLLIVDLIKKDFKKINDARLIIQANRNTYEVRKFLTELGYYIYDEEIIFEDNKYYEIIVFEKTNQPFNYKRNELYFGPVLLERKDRVLKEKMKNELRILNNIPHKNEEIICKINLVKENLW